MPKNSRFSHRIQSTPELLPFTNARIIQDYKEYAPQFLAILKRLDDRYRVSSFHLLHTLFVFSHLILVYILFSKSIAKPSPQTLQHKRSLPIIKPRWVEVEPKYVAALPPALPTGTDIQTLCTSLCRLLTQPPTPRSQIPIDIRLELELFWGNRQHIPSQEENLAVQIFLERCATNVSTIGLKLVKMLLEDAGKGGISEEVLGVFGCCLLKRWAADREVWYDVGEDALQKKGTERGYLDRMVRK